EITVATANGPRKEKRTVTSHETVTKMIDGKVEEKGSEFSTAGGVKLTYQEAADRLKNGAICLLAHPGPPVESAYLKAFKDDTLVVRMPPQAVAPQPGVRPALAPPAMLAPAQQGIVPLPTPAAAVPVVKD